MEVINLNLIPTGALPVVHASQYDEGRTFRANLMDGSTVYTLDGTETLECDVKKPDGNIVTVTVTNTSDSYVEIDTTLQMCACAGESLAELHITKGAQEIGTLNFILAVERSPLEGGIQSDSGIHNLQTQIGEAVAEQYAAEDVVFDAAPVAGHGTGFAVTSEGVKTYVEGEIGALTIPEELDDLQDVELTSPTAGQIMEYDGAKWKNVANPASTTNFGAPYNENATYTVPSLVIYNNLLYKLNAGEDGTTGPWDPTKWTQTSVAELAQLIGDLTTLTTNVKSSLVKAVNEVDADKADKATTIAGYGITNAYTKTEVDNYTARRYTTLWGTSCQTTIGRAQFITITNRVLYVVWLASTNDINVANVAANTYQSGTGSVTLDNVTFTRLSNSNLKVQLSGSGTIMIIG